MLVKCIDGPAKGEEYEVPADYKPGAVVRIAKRGPLGTFVSVRELFDSYVFDGESLKAA